LSTWRLTILLQKCGNAIVAGRNLRRIWNGNRDGGHGELRRRDSGTVADYHFSLPYILDEQGRPDASTIDRRDSASDGYESTLTHDYVYSQSDETICRSSQPAK
jgi:hypothetical protein